MFVPLFLIFNVFFSDDWDGFLIDRTKLGLGLFSVSFDILFMIQHYVLYRYVYFKAFGSILSNIRLICECSNRLDCKLGSIFKPYFDTSLKIAFFLTNSKTHVDRLEYFYGMKIQQNIDIVKVREIYLLLMKYVHGYNFWLRIFE